MNPFRYTLVCITYVMQFYNAKCTLFIVSKDFLNDKHKSHLHNMSICRYTGLCISVIYSFIYFIFQKNKITALCAYRDVSGLFSGMVPGVDTVRETNISESEPVLKPEHIKRYLLFYFNSI